MKTVFLICLSLLLVGLSGCSKAPSSTPNENQQPSESSSKNNTGIENLIVPSKETKPEPQTSDFKEGITIDFTKYQKEFLTTEILDMLKNNLEAVIDQNKEKFHQNMSDNYKEGNNSLIENENKYMFKNIHLAQKDNENKRINIGIEFLFTSDEKKIKSGNMVYTLMENKKGMWEITLIDFDNPL
ncbi:hypothetical protein SAMN05444162_1469 [Paenibacillaceae bacterium GAS479]|nr:hypothetical protein SAMN05444162_1469 [Paenibacillaceae bacterium GAS479]